MDLHFDFNQKTDKGYYSKVTNEKGEILASKITNKKVNVDDFVLNLINNEELSLDLRAGLKEAYENKEVNENKIEINKTCIGVAICLTTDNDSLNCSRIIIHFNEGPRIRLNIDQDVSYDFDNLYDLLKSEIKDIEILEDSVIFHISGFKNPVDIECNIKVLEFVWRT